MSEYTVRVCLMDEYKCTYHQTFSRGDMRMSREAFNAFALGTMLTMISTGYTDSLAFASAQQGTSFPINIVRVAIEIVDGANTEDSISERFVSNYGM